MTCDLCGAAEARWAQFAHGQYRACDFCVDLHRGSYKSGGPLALPADDDKRPARVAALDDLLA